MRKWIADDAMRGVGRCEARSGSNARRAVGVMHGMEWALAPVAMMERFVQLG